MDLDGTLLEEDNATQVAFQAVEGQGQLAADEGVVGDGRVARTLMTIESGNVVVQASTAGLEAVRLTVVATPLRSCLNGLRVHRARVPQEILS